MIIVDLAMRTGALGGLSFIRRLRLHDQRTPVLVFTMHSDPVIVSRALEVGATGYVLKDTSSEEVLKAFQKVREGRPYLSHDLASEVAFMEARGTTNPLKRMTVRELQTLALVAEGKPYGVIAEHLHVSYKTVANTCTQLKAKLGVRTLPELMRIAIQHLPSGDGASPEIRSASPGKIAVRRCAGARWWRKALPLGDFLQTYQARIRCMVAIVSPPTCNRFVVTPTWVSEHSLQFLVRCHACDVEN